MSKATKITQNKDALSALLRLASITGYHPLQTLYGSGVWSTSSSSSFYDKDGEDQVEKSGSGASTADSAYSSTSLPLHTNLTYSSNPPVLQVFLMVQPAAVTALSSPLSDPHVDGPIPP